MQNTPEDYTRFDLLEVFRIGCQIYLLTAMNTPTRVFQGSEGSIFGRLHIAPNPLQILLFTSIESGFF
jgi:hypothetical protein